MVGIERGLTMVIIRHEKTRLLGLFYQVLVERNHPECSGTDISGNNLEEGMIQSI